MSVGRSEGNHFALSEADQLAPQHAVFREVQGKWLVESVCDRPLTVGNGRPAQLAWLSSGDTVHLAESVPDLLFEMTVSAPADRQFSPAAPAPVVPSPPPLPTPVRPPVPPAASGTVVQIAPHGNSAVPRPSEPPAPQPVGMTTRQQGMLLMTTGVLGMAALVLTGVLFLLRSPAPSAPPLGTPAVAQNNLVPSSPVADRAEPPSPRPEPPEPAPSREPAVPPKPMTPAVDPAEFLVLVGAGDLSTDNRPIVLGVGWLWNERTVVVSRFMGDAISEIVRSSKDRGQPRSGCAIQGVPLPVSAVRNPSGLDDLSLLTLSEPARLPARPIRQWRQVGAADVQRLRERKEPLQYVSYARLPRPASVKGNHGFSLMPYNPDAVSITSVEPKFEYEERRHLIRLGDEPTVERGGLIVDRSGQILGMLLWDAHVLWTADLEGRLPPP